MDTLSRRCRQVKHGSFEEKKCIQSAAKAAVHCWTRAMLGPETAKAMATSSGPCCVLWRSFWLYFVHSGEFHSFVVNHFKPKIKPVSPGKLFETQIQVHPRPTECATLGAEPQNIILLRTSGDSDASCARDCLARNLKAKQLKTLPQAQM